MALPIKKLIKNRKNRRELRIRGIKPSAVLKTIKELKAVGIWDESTDDERASLLAVAHAPDDLAGFDPSGLIALFAALMPLIKELMEICSDI